MKNILATILTFAFLVSCQKESAENGLVGDYTDIAGGRVLANICPNGARFKMTIFDRDAECDYACFLNPMELLSRKGDDTEFSGESVLGTPNRHTGGRTDETVLVSGEFKNCTLFLSWPSNAGGCSKTLHLKKLD